LPLQVSQTNFEILLIEVVKGLLDGTAQAVNEIKAIKNSGTSLQKYKKFVGLFRTEKCLVDFTKVFIGLDEYNV